MNAAFMVQLGKGQVVLRRLHVENRGTFGSSCAVRGVV